MLERSRRSRLRFAAKGSATLGFDLCACVVVVVVVVVVAVEVEVAVVLGAVAVAAAAAVDDKSSNMVAEHLGLLPASPTPPCPALTVDNDRQHP